MKLKKLVSSLPKYNVSGDESLEITSVVADSRRVEKGSLFVSIKGDHFDGHSVIDEVIQKGALAVVGEEKPHKEWKDIAYIQVRDSREALGHLASEWYGNPSRKMKVIGVTGTDGKTTTSNIIWWIIKKSSQKVGLVSTINAKVGGKELDTGFHVTSPVQLDLQKYLSMMVDAGCKYAVVEVTSHGIDQKRIAGIKFDAAVLTNITHEHLDYHKTFEEYRSVKSRLFKGAQFAVLNQDDPSFGYVKKNAKGSKVISYSIYKNSNYRVDEIEESLDGMKFRLLHNDGPIEIQTKLIGEYNVSNILAAVGVARAYHCSWAEIQDALKTFSRPEGRLEEIKNDKGIRIYVDFAHTPNSLEQVLKHLRRHTKGRLISIFGCASERDLKKRGLMPPISIHYSNVSIFTAEDPRFEDITLILEAMARSAKKAGGKEMKIDFNKKNVRLYDTSNVHTFIRIPGRGDAIFTAIHKIAKAGDTIVICGKRHEKSMAYKGIEYTWSDQEAVRDALNGKVKQIAWKKH